MKGGRVFNAPIDIVHGETIKAWWGEGYPGIRPRRHRARAVLFHHTGGEGDARQIFNTLNGGRKSKKTGKPMWLSVPFTIDRDSVITQHADLDAVCFHAGTANNWTIGVEIANRGKAPSIAGVDRLEYDDECHGRPIKYLRFFPDQVGAAYDLARALCDLDGIPWQFPMDGSSILRTTMTQPERDEFHGICGHLHVSRRKTDPSPHLLYELHRRASMPSR